MMRSLPPRALALTLVAALALFACGKKDDGGKGAAAGGKAKAGAKAKAGTKAAAPTTKAGGPALKAPASVIVYGGTNGLADTLKKAHKLASTVAPMPPADQLAGQASQMLAGDFRLKNGEGLDLSKPIRFAVLDPKKHRDPLLMVGMKSKDAFIKTLPDLEKKENDQGNAFSYVKYKGSTRPIFVNFAGDFAVFSRDKDAFPKHKAFAEALAKATMPDLGAAYIELDHIAAIFGAEMDQGIAQIKQTLTMVGGSTPGANADQMKAMGTIFDWVGKAAREVDYIRVTAKADPDGARLDIRIAAKKGSPLAGTLTAFKSAGAHKLLAKLPADAPFFVSISADPAANVKMMNSISDLFIVGPLFKGDKAKAKPYIEAMVNYAKSLDGHMVVAAHGKDGLTLSALMGVTDGKTARAAQMKLVEMQKDPMAIEYYKTMGLVVDYKPDAYKIGDTPVAISKTTMGNVPPAAAPMMALMNDFMTQHIAIGDKLGAIGYGAGAKAQLEALLGGKTGGLDAVAGVKRAVKNAAGDAFMLMYVSPIELAQRVKLGGMNTFAAQLAGVPPGMGLAMSAGHAGDELQIVVDVPVDLVKSGMAAFQKVKGGL